MAAEFDALVRDLGDRSEPQAWWFMAGRVVGTPSGSPSTVQVELAGGLVQPLRYPQGVTLTDGNVVWVACKGSSAMFVAFVLA